MDDRALLRDLQKAIQETQGNGWDAQSRAIYAVLERHGASEDDVRRLLGRARERRRVELAGLQRRLDKVIEEKDAASATADAVDRFLRDHPSSPEQGSE